MDSAPKRKITLQLPALYPKQQEAIYSPSRFSLIEASTKSGKTHGCMVWALDNGFKLKAGEEGWWVAPIRAQANIAFKRICRALPQGTILANKSNLTITLLQTGGVLVFQSGENPDSLFGENVHFAILDEASRMREEAWFAMRSTLTYTKGPVRIIGNVKGRKNWFYRMCRKAQGGAENYAYHKITAWDAVEAGVLDQEEIESARDDLPEAVFNELYLAEPSDDGGNPFGMNWIEECTGEMSDNDPVVYGWDLAKSHDFTVGIGLDENGRMCRYQRFQKPWRETTRLIIKEIGDVPTLVDSIGVGDPIVEDLQAECPQVEGFKFSSSSKQVLMEGLAVAIQGETIVFTEEVKTELDIFEYEYSRRGVSYSAPPGYFDDRVCALALANKHLRDKGRMVDDTGFY